MILKIILGLAAAFAIFWTIKTKKISPAIISGGMIVGILFVFFPSESIQTSGLFIYMGFVALAFIYGFFVKDKTIISRITIILMTASILAYWLWVLNHWHGNAVLFPLFTLLVATVGIFGKAKWKNELGFIVILIADAIAILIENWMKAG